VVRIEVAALRRGAIALAAGVLVALAVAPGVLASAEDDLAQKYAPVVRLADRAFRCEVGEPFGPIDVDLLFDEPTVALRGPWNATDLVKIAPSAEDLPGLFEYHLDFPGSALDPGCDYELWAARLKQGSEPTIYAHVATEPGRPGKLALQYWLFYVFNDFNNLHEGDWEMIQLVFDAATPEEALTRDPVAAGYSSHEGAEGADWGDEKLELVGGTRPVVYPAAGSHANKFTPALYLGNSAETGVGCDDTREPHREVRPTVKTIPGDPEAARQAFPWIAFEGRWGERQEAFFNGPRGPNLNDRWTAPITWSETWRSRSYAIPTGGVLGSQATDFFCTAVETGSKGLVALLRNPAVTLLVLALVVVLLVWIASRTTWRPAVPLRIARRRSWGKILSSAARMLLERPFLFLGIGLLFIPLAIVIAFVQTLLLGGFGLLGVDATGEGAGAAVFLLVAVGTTLTLLGLGLVQAATACALVEIDQGRSIRALGAYRLAVTRIRSLLGGLGVGVLVWSLLAATGFLLPVAVFLAVRWLLLAPVVVLEGRSGPGSLRRSAQLVRGRWFRVGSIVGVGAVLALAAGPLLGALLILVTDAPFVLLNLVAGVVYALAMPYVALATAYVYFDARVREELGDEHAPGELPAEAAI
jgi:hypothetical protein